MKLGEVRQWTLFSGHAKFQLKPFTVWYIFAMCCNFVSFVYVIFAYVTCYRSADVTDETRIRLLLLNIKNNNDSLLGWMLPRMHIIPQKKGSNKSFLTSNFGQKSPRRHMSIFTPEWSQGARKMIWFKYEIVQKRKNTFTFRLNAAKNTHYAKKRFK